MGPSGLPDNRRLLLGLVALCVVAILWTLGTFWVRSRAVDDNIARVNKEAADRAYATCLSGNDFRARDLQTWEYILNLFPPSKDPAARARTEQFHQFIVNKDAPRDCQALVKETP